MRPKEFLPVLWALLVSTLLFLAHKSVFHYFFSNTESGFTFPLETLYLFFGSCCAVITLVSVLVKKFSINNVGQSFMLTTFIEIGLCFGFFYPDLKTGTTEMSPEKINFLSVFLLFLAIETFLTIRLLNKNQ